MNLNGQVAIVTGGSRGIGAAVGAHNDEVLRELGYDEEQIAVLKASKALGQGEAGGEGREGARAVWLTRRRRPLQRESSLRTRRT